MSSIYSIAREIVPFLHEVISDSFVIPMGEQWAAKQLVVRLEYLDKIDDAVVFKIGGKEYRYFIVTGERKIGDFRRDVLFVKCELIMQSNQTIYINCRGSYDLWIEGKKSCEP